MSMFRGNQESRMEDRIHGSFQIPEQLQAVLRTQCFERLQDLKQLGVAYKVFPSATHTRLEHSLGVMALTIQLVRSLEGSLTADAVRPLRVKDVAPTSAEVLQVAMAALCHDIAHGPYSHLWEAVMCKLGGTRWCHEVMGKTLVDHLVAALRDADSLPPGHFLWDPLSDNEAAVKSMIAGDGSGVSAEKQWLYQLVANSISGFDTDKWDYLLRDATAVPGSPMRVTSRDLQNLISGARVVFNPATQATEVAMARKDWHTVNALFEGRAAMHLQVYRQMDVVPQEKMLKEQIALLDTPLKLSAAAHDPASFITLTESKLDRAIKEPPRMAKADKEHVLKRARQMAEGTGWQALCRRAVPLCLSQPSPGPAGTLREHKTACAKVTAQLQAQIAASVCEPLEAFAAELGVPRPPPQHPFFAAQLERISEGRGPHKAMDSVLFWEHEQQNNDSQAAPGRLHVMHLQHAQLMEQESAAHEQVACAEKAFVHVMYDCDVHDASAHAQLRARGEHLLQTLFAQLAATQGGACAAPIKLERTTTPLPRKRAREMLGADQLQPPATPAAALSGRGETQAVGPPPAHTRMQTPLQPPTQALVPPTPSAQTWSASAADTQTPVRSSVLPSMPSAALPAHGGIGVARAHRRNEHDAEGADSPMAVAERTQTQMAGAADTAWDSVPDSESDREEAGTEAVPGATAQHVAVGDGWGSQEPAWMSSQQVATTTEE